MTQIANIPDAAASTKFPAWPTVKSYDGAIYTSPVGHFRPNHFGLHDMLGNVFEYCSDWFDHGYYKNSPDSDPRGPLTGTAHVARGGSFIVVAGSHDRWVFSDNVHVPDVGFRVVRDVPPPANP
jgi:formylglycine-generating enzyme